MNQMNLRKSFQKLNPLPQSTPNKGFPPLPGSDNSQGSVFFLFGKLRIIMQSQNNDLIALLERTSDYLLKNGLHPSLMGQIVIQDIEQGFGHLSQEQLKKVALSVKVFYSLSRDSHFPPRVRELFKRSEF